MNITISQPQKLSSVLIVALVCLMPNVAHADTSVSSTSAPRVLQQALASHDAFSLYNNKHKSGFDIAGGFFAGRASGIDPVASNYLGSTVDGSYQFDRTAELEGDQRVYAVMVDSRYSFNNDFGSGLPIHPFLTGGVGMAVYRSGGAGQANLGLQNDNTVPLARVGGGIALDLGQQWNMSLDYTAGFSGSRTDVNTGVAQSAEVQTLNLGMHYKF
jgi:hypothetical protein